MIRHLQYMTALADYPRSAPEHGRYRDVCRPLTFPPSYPWCLISVLHSRQIWGRGEIMTFSKSRIVSSQDVSRPFPQRDRRRTMAMRYLLLALQSRGYKTGISA